MPRVVFHAKFIKQNVMRTDRSTPASSERIFGLALKRVAPKKKRVVVVFTPLDECRGVNGTKKHSRLST